MARLRFTIFLVLLVRGGVTRAELNKIDGGLPDYEYFVSNMEAHSWLDARDRCRDIGADLFEITDKNAEDEIITKATDLNYNKFMWIGANRLESDQWRWPSGALVDGDVWEVGYPVWDSTPQLCAAVHSGSTLLSTEQCMYSRQYICKRQQTTAPPPTMGPTQDTPVKGSCPNGFYGAGEKCYRLFHDEQTWKQASLKCQDLGVGSRSALASFQNAAENAAVTAQLEAENPGYWIGLYFDIGTNWFWTDNSPNYYSNWVVKPDDSKQCGYIQSEKGVWSSTDVCTQKKPYICHTHRVEQTTTAAPTPDNRCPIGYTYYRENCFQFFPTPLSWDAALESCENNNENGTLTSIHTFAENAFLLLTIAEQKQPAWTGLTKLKYSWVWSDSSYMSFSHFGAEVPEGPHELQRCAEMRQDGYWYKMNCSEPRPYICKIPLGDLPQRPDNSDGVCPPNHGEVWNGDTNSNYCYAAKTEEEDWETAMYSCARAHTASYLVSIHSLEENEFVRDLAKKSFEKNNSTNPWLGYIRSKNDGRFIWVDGSAVEYEPWVPGSPNLGGTCVAARMLVGEQHTDGPWEDAFCSDRNPYVCKVPKGPKVDYPQDAGGTCPSDEWERYGSYCMLFNVLSTNLHTWADARAQCRALGADLAEPNDNHLNEFLKQGSNSDSPLIHSYFWIGLKRLEGGDFIWASTLEKPTYEAWSQDNEPGFNKNCVMMKVSTTEWFQTQCDSYHGYVCQKLQDMGGSEVTTAEPEGPESPGDKGGLHGGAIPGIVIGVLLLVALIVLGVLILVRYRDKICSKSGPERFENED